MRGTEDGRMKFRRKPGSSCGSLEAGKAGFRDYLSLKTQINQQPLDFAHPLQDVDLPLL
jgi:hypothetical protein